MHGNLPDNKGKWMVTKLQDILSDPTLVREGSLVGGQWQMGGSTFAVTNPATGDVIANVAEGGAAETAMAIEAAQAAFSKFAEMTALERAAILTRWQQLCLENLEDLAKILTMEEGKPLAEAKAEISQGLSYLPWYGAQAQRVCGELIPPSRRGSQAVTRFSPLGVAAAIVPWNFPFSMLPRKLAPALAAGCTAVVKPSRRTPLSALAFLELGVRAGLPAGTINAVSGRASVICDVIAKSPVVRKVSFTGSTRIGKELAAACAPSLKRMSLELGGNAPFIVFADADLERSLNLATATKFRNAGQTCICANRFLVQEGIADAFTSGLVAKATALRLGNGLDPETQMGPLISAEAAQRVDGLVKDAVAAGARLLCGGKVSSLGPSFYEPTVLANVTPGMRIFREEIFGPVAPVIVFRTDEEAISLANDTDFGLASYACTENITRIWRMYDKLQYGMVGINDITLASADTPFGGIKDSGMGREGGTHAILEFMEEKYMLLGNLG